MRMADRDSSGSLLGPYSWSRWAASAPVRPLCEVCRQWGVGGGPWRSEAGIGAGGAGCGAHGPKRDLRYGQVPFKVHMQGGCKKAWV